MDHAGARDDLAPVGDELGRFSHRLFLSVDVADEHRSRFHALSVPCRP